MRPNRSIPLASTLLALLLSACQPPKSPPLTGTGMDMFAPVKMRLHPLSRLQNNIVEARLEFTDQFGAVGKGVGSVTFQLSTYNALFPNHQGSAINTWHMDLLTPAENALHWDAITRTYLFALPLKPEDARTGKFTLAAVFTLPNGEKLTDTLTLSSK